MAEPRTSSLRPIGVRRSTGRVLRAAAAVAAVALAVSACGSGETPDAAEGPTSSSPSSSSPSCPAPRTVDLGVVDVDGDATYEKVVHLSAAGTGCTDSVVVEFADGTQFDVGFDQSLPVRPLGLKPISVPARKGALVLITQTHPRGGFVAHLAAWDGEAMVNVGGDGPLIPFVATDAPTQHAAAVCTATGFDVLTARAHQPVGVVPAWDVSRTSYRARGDAVVAAGSAEVADNVLDEDLSGRFPVLTRGHLFRGCGG